MPRGRGRGGFSRGFWGWPGNPYPFCRFFPWLPRRWWRGSYGPLTPWTTYGAPASPQDQELTGLEDRIKGLERTLEQISKRLDELKTRGEEA
jgi:hypothetical protein